MKRIILLLTATFIGSLVSCTTLPISDRAFVSQTGMKFDQKGAKGYDCGLFGQVETGSVTAGGAAGATCSTCH